MLSLTEASAPRESGFGNQGYHNGLLGNHTAAATTAANVVFPRSGQTSPSISQTPSPFPAQAIVERPAKPEKSKVKLFSRPGKIGTKGEPKDKPLPSPSKIGSALASLQRGNFSTSSLVDSSASSLYSLNNSSSATIRALETPIEQSTGREKEKKHNFLSRQKHKLTSKDDYHLSTISSNSRSTEGSGPASSLYNFHIPSSPGPGTSSFSKGISSLDIRHAGRKDKRSERVESRLESEASFGLGSEWSGPSSVPSVSAQSSMYLSDTMDSNKYGLNGMALDDAWPYLKAKLLVIFEAEEVKVPIEDLNRIVSMHIQFCLQRRSPNIIVEDLRDLFTTGFASQDRTLRKTPEDRVIHALVELWIFTFTSILPYMQAVFLPLDLEFSGCGPLMNPEQARDFWGGVIASSTDQSPHVSPASSVLDVRRLVLNAYRDVVILPRYDTLKTIFSRLSLEFLPSSLASIALASPPLEPPMLSTSPSDSISMIRPGTAMSLDPSIASYNSSSTTLLGDGSAGGGNRSRAISNVSFGSHGSDGGPRPFTPSSLQVLGSGSLGSLREQNVEDSKQVTEMVGRMLQCMSVLANVGVTADRNDESNRRMEELCRLLKLNWLGRGRTGRNRRGMVGGRVRRDIQRDDVREEVRVG
jgi:hypothetical protein